MDTGANILNKTLQRVPEHSAKIIHHDHAGLIPDAELVHIYNSINVINFVTDIKDRNHLVSSTDTERL